MGEDKFVPPIIRFVEEGKGEMSVGASWQNAPILPRAGDVVIFPDPERENVAVEFEVRQVRFGYGNPDRRRDKREVKLFYVDVHVKRVEQPQARRERSKPKTQ
ncbi:MAG TPA: hypothetical protein VGK99_18605 [Acidobacteriota bacterium]|jgi:hypothetical protein